MFYDRNSKNYIWGYNITLPKYSSLWCPNQKSKSKYQCAIFRTGIKSNCLFIGKCYFNYSTVCIIDPILYVNLNGTSPSFEINTKHNTSIFPTKTTNNIQTSTNSINSSTELKTSITFTTSIRKNFNTITTTVKNRLNGKINFKNFYLLLFS